MQYAIHTRKLDGYLPTCERGTNAEMRPMHAQRSRERRFMLRSSKVTNFINGRQQRGPVKYWNRRIWSALYWERRKYHQYRQVQLKLGGMSHNLIHWLQEPRLFWVLLSVLYHNDKRGENSILCTYITKGKQLLLTKTIQVTSYEHRSRIRRRSTVPTGIKHETCACYQCHSLDFAGSHDMCAVNKWYWWHPCWCHDDISCGTLVQCQLVSLSSLDKPYPLYLSITSFIECRVSYEYHKIIGQEKSKNAWGTSYFASWVYYVHEYEERRKIWRGTWSVDDPRANRQSRINWGHISSL